MGKAKQSKKSAPETDDFICFESGDAWVNANKQRLVESSGKFDAIFIESFCGSEVLLGPIQARKLANKILGWCNEIDGK